MRYVIVGGGVAAIRAVESIRQLDQKGEIYLVTAENDVAYSRPLITHYLAGEVSEEQMPYKDEQFFAQNQVRVIKGCRAREINYKKQVVYLEDGRELPYEKLLLATGSSVKYPPLKGINLKGIMTFYTLDDARKVKELVAEGKKDFIVLGGGLIGIRAAVALKKLGAKVKIVELLPNVLRRVLDEKAASLVEEKLKSEGIEVITNCRVEEIVGENGFARGLKVQGKGELNCNALIISTGVQPNVELAGDLAVERGIIVNEYMQATYNNVYAAGDCVEAYDFVKETKAVNALWPNASEQGKIAGWNMAGRPVKYKGSMAMNSFEVNGLNIISMGVVDPQAEGLRDYEERVRYGRSSFIYQKLVFLNGKLKGAILVSDLGLCSVIRELVAGQLPAVLVKDVILEEKYPLYEYIKKIRKDKLEGRKVKWPETYVMQEKYQKTFDEEKWMERIENKRSWV